LRKVAVLGGGMAGLAAAWALSGKELEGQFEVTVYQRGWRLGGKGAGSRGINGRIEEHGLHVWLGYYENAFRLLRDVYDELDRSSKDPDCPIRSWRDAVAPAPLVGVADSSGGEWSHWIASMNLNDREPGTAEEGAPPLSPAAFVQRGLRLLVDFAASLAPPSAPSDLACVVLSGSPQRPTGRRGGLREGALIRQAETALSAGVAELLRLLGDAVAADPAALGPLFVDTVDRMRSAIVLQAERNDRRRRTVQVVDLVVTCMRGAVRDGLLTDVTGFAAIDHLDFREWLARHGAAPETLRSPLIRGLYDLAFAYEDGDPARPRFAAGLGLFLAGKFFFDYSGAIFWQLRAGMGDVVVAPLYEALRARGVRFAFFHRVDRLHLDEQAAGIGAITLGRQTRTHGDREYDALVRVGGLPCFPSRPRLEQLSAPVPDDLESHWSDRSGEERVRLLAGVDYDDVVLATSVGMLPHICPELIEHSPRWRMLVDGVATVPTQSLQLWLRPDERRLGWPHAGATVSGHVAPFDTYASMSHVAVRESWPDEALPGTIGYFCSVLDAGLASDPRAAHDVVRLHAVEFLDRHVGRLWPGAVAEGGGFRWSLLCGADPGAGAAALDTQYWRANVDPSDRYVQSLPGTGAYRLRADGSGYANLFLAGDWIRCGLDAGCVEAAVMAGRQAANAVRGRPIMEGIRGSWYAVPPT
jgi:uncharacterized protein with NAD-binding domain and iron-sulfur cluster